MNFYQLIFSNRTKKSYNGSRSSYRYEFTDGRRASAGVSGGGKIERALCYLLRQKKASRENFSLCPLVSFSHPTSHIRYFRANGQPSSRSVATLRYLQNFFAKWTIKVLRHNLQFNNTASFNDALIFFIFITLYWLFFSSFATLYLALSSFKLVFGHYFTFISWQSLHFSSLINTCLGYM